MFLYVISAFKKDSVHSIISSGLTYFILVAFSSSLFLFGSSSIYGLTGLTSFCSFNFFFFDHVLFVDSLLEGKNFTVFFISSSCLDLWVIHTFFILDIDSIDVKQENNNKLPKKCDNIPLVFFVEWIETLNLSE